MDNKFQLILYLVFGIIYVISRFLKSKNNPPAEYNSDDSYEAPAKPPLSFEDLLREFTGEGNSTTPPRTLKEVYKEPEPIIVEYETSDDEIQEKYQKSIVEANKALPKEELDSKKLRHSVDYKRFDEFEIEEGNGLLSEITDDLNDPEGLKKALIYKEIFDRKY